MTDWNSSTTGEQVFNKITKKLSEDDFKEYYESTDDNWLSSTCTPYEDDPWQNSTC